MTTKNNYFIGFWSNEGFESITDVTKYSNIDKLNTFLRLAEKPAAKDPVGEMIHFMQLRARYNPQRNYEIYAMMTDPEITHECLQEIADSSPQEAAMLFRNHGIPILKKQHISESVIK